MSIATYYFTTTTGTFAIQHTNIHSAQDALYAKHEDVGRILSYKVSL